MTTISLSATGSRNAPKREGLIEVSRDISVDEVGDRGDAKNNSCDRLAQLAGQ